MLVVAEAVARTAAVDTPEILFVCSAAQETPAGSFARRGFPSAAVTTLDAAAIAGSSCLLFDIDLEDVALVERLRRTVEAVHPHPPMVFAVDGGVQLHHQTTQANALGASLTVERPFDRAAIAKALAALRVPVRRPAEHTAGRGHTSIVAAHRLIGASFAALSTGAPIALEQAELASRELFQGIGQAGLNDWLDAVRSHHAGTFQHCLLVTGAVVAYAAEAQIPERRRTILTIAALLHDIGKAAIPNEILDKPGALTKEEFSLIKAHPRIGADYLGTQRHLSPIIVDAVLHHHEYLDGSGYPDRLSGEQISPSTRIITVCDIYGALVEQRAYRPAKTQAEALYVLIRMAQQGKLDYEVVRTLAAALGAALPERPV
jgi:putative nucleotidyltransferase with HDIG domain